MKTKLPKYKIGEAICFNSDEYGIKNYGWTMIIAQIDYIVLKENEYVYHVNSSDMVKESDVIKKL